jgi:cobalt/nickel transport protein
MKSSALTAAAAGLLLAGPAQAHFQLLYTPEVMLEKPAEIGLKLVFGHPMENGHVMDMDAPQEFFVVHKGSKTDLKDTLEPVAWKGPDNEAKAFQTTYKVRRNGDYLFVVNPAPYMEGAEDIYIQQITKTIVNKGAMPTGWHEPVGLPTEIVPLTKPYQAFAGGTFTGQLLSDGKPAAGVECEIEYINTDVRMDANAFGKKHHGPVPPSAIATITDANGLFTFGIPRPGTWGFACLGSGPDKEHKGKGLSQDAVLWIHAASMD